MIGNGDFDHILLFVLQVKTTLLCLRASVVFSVAKTIISELAFVPPFLCVCVCLYCTFFCFRQYCLSAIFFHQPVFCVICKFLSNYFFQLIICTVTHRRPISQIIILSQSVSELVVYLFQFGCSFYISGQDDFFLCFPFISLEPLTLGGHIRSSNTQVKKLCTPALASIYLYMLSTIVKKKNHLKGILLFTFPTTIFSLGVQVLFCFLPKYFFLSFFVTFLAQKYPMVRLLQKDDSLFNQELLRSMVKSIKMNDVYGPMSQVLERRNKGPHIKRQRQGG